MWSHDKIPGHQASHSTDTVFTKAKTASLRLPHGVCRMALIKTAISAEELLAPNSASHAELTISVPGQEDLKVKLLLGRGIC